MCYLLLLVIALVPFVSGQACGHFDYNDPDVEWPTLDCPGKVNQCDKTKYFYQSPVVILTGTSANLLPLDWHGYESFSSVAVNNGHTLSIKAPENYTGGFKGYNLNELHFHVAAENVEFVNGHEAMVIHFVHKNPTTGALAVLGLTFRVEPINVTMPWIKPVIDSVQFIPTFNSSVEVSLGPLQEFFDELKKSANDAYFLFDGSLTTPPCTEGVKWHLLHFTGVISADDLETIKKVSSHNNRPIQRTLVDVAYYSPASSVNSDVYSFKDWALPTSIVVIVVGVSICVLLIVLIVIGNKSSDDDFRKL